MRNDNEVLATALLPEATHHWDEDEHLIEDDGTAVRSQRAGHHLPKATNRPRRQRKSPEPKEQEFYVPRSIVALRPDIESLLQQQRLLNGRIAAALKEAKENGIAARAERLPAGHAIVDRPQRLPSDHSEKLDRIEALLEQRMQPKVIQFRVALALAAIAFIFGTVFGGMGS